MNVLSIDTSRNNLVRVAIDCDTEHFEKEHEQKFGSQVLMGLIEDTLKAAGVEYSDLNEIVVATGPGSYTGLRVGAAVGNALAYSLGIPVNGKNLETELEYA